MRTRSLLSIAAVSTSLVLAGCTTTQRHTGTGAAVGGILGGMAGHNLGSGSGDRDKGALLGAGVGALVGNQMGKQKEQTEALEKRVSDAESRSQQMQVWIHNSNGSRTPVTLRRGQGGTWVGPKGEVYTEMPSKQQLKSVYGF